MPSAFAENPSAPMCINKADPNNTQLLESISANRDPLRLAYLVSKKEKTAQKNDSNVCPETDPFKKQIKTISRVLAQATGQNIEAKAAPQPKSAKETAYVPTGPRPALIKKECIKASLQRAPGNTGYTCDADNTPKPYGTAGGATLQCVTDETADYITFSVNKAIQCMSPKQPIDSRVLYTKINNESGFNFSLASPGGVSSPQLTTRGAGEVGHPTKGNGHYLLQEIIDSKNPACEPFKNIARQDLKDSPLPITRAKYCDWINPGNGLARSLVYSIGLYLTQRDYYIIPAVEKRAPSLTKNRGVMNALSAIAYGREGVDHAKWLLQKYRVDKNTTASRLRKELLHGSEYLKEMEDKTREAACINRGLHPSSNKCEGLKLSQSQLDGDECVTK